MSEELTLRENSSCGLRQTQGPQEPIFRRASVTMLNDDIDPGQNFVTCPNQDVVYGLGFFSLDEEPVILQVPDFGDRFWVYALYSLAPWISSAKSEPEPLHFFQTSRDIWNRVGITSLQFQN